MHHPNYCVPSHLSILQTGITRKRSPLHIKNWISCVLTLDGRDKFTKILQYTSRLLCWYFAGLAKNQQRYGASSAKMMDAAAGGAVSASASLLSMNFTNHHLRQQYYSALSKRFDELYKSLVTSRKAFRLGRSIIELDKLSSMGWGEYLRYMLLHPLAEGVAVDIDDSGGAASKIGNMQAKCNSIRYDTHPIPEEEGDEDHHDDENEDEDDSSNEGEEKKLDTPTSSTMQRKVVSRPGRPKLLTKVSSNIGWGPSSTPVANTTDASMTQTSSSDKTSSIIPSPSISTPSWKLIGGTIKLLGLMGFWAFDNISFLTGSGFFGSHYWW